MRNIIATMGLASIILMNLASSCLAQRLLTTYVVCVSNEKSGDVTIIDGPNGDVMTTVPVGRRPRGIHASADGRLLYVALSGSPYFESLPLDAERNVVKYPDHSADGIAVIDLQRGALVRRLSVGSDPEQFLVDPSGFHLYVPNRDMATVSVVDMPSGKIIKVIPVGTGPGGISFAPNGKLIYVTCEADNWLFSIDPGNNQIADQYPVGANPRMVKFMPNGASAFVPSASTNYLNIINMTNLALVSTVALPKGSHPTEIAVGRDAKTLYVTSGTAGTVCLVDVPGKSYIKSVAVGPHARGIGISPSGKTIYVANGPSNDISVIDVETAREIKRIKTGKGPWGIEVVQLK
ncbi:beta-propeller fold lactonase family protein [Pedosphaera parvula]|nr:beta-propeller fold lactonase family protein [Pedosphaera parvula]